jgi:hypothetical protein
LNPFFLLLSSLYLIIVRERFPRYSTNSMEDGRSAYSAYSEFDSSAANAVTIITDFCNLREVPAPPRVDIQRIAYLEKLADELERGLSHARRVLEEAPPLTELKDLKAELATLRERYTACWRQWRGERGQELTPPRLWRRLGNVEKALKTLYQDVCDCLEDHLDVEEAERRLADPNEVPVPYEQARKELGLD